MQSKIPSISLFDTNVEVITRDQLMRQLSKFIESNRFHHIVTPNTEMIIRARRDDDFRSILNRSDLRLADGVGVVWAMRWLYGIKQERLSGADICYDLFSLADKHRLKVLLIGSKHGLNPDAAKLAVQQLQKKYPSASFIGVSCAVEDPPNQVFDTADIAIVGLGVPAEEIWLARYGPSLANLRIGIGAGATIDFIAGVQKRAPLWLQKFGLEWLWRLVRQPSRIVRQLSIPHFMLLVVLAKLGLINNTQ